MIKSVDSKNETNYSLAYFGAGWDFKPIRDFGINRKGLLAEDGAYNKFNHFIFIDALPKLSHYEPGMSGYEKSKNKEALIKTLKNEALKYSMTLKKRTGNMLTFLSENKDIKIQYYINTTVEEALNDPIIRNKLNKVKWLHEEGFHPYAYGLKVGDLPNLVRCRAMLKEL